MIYIFWIKKSENFVQRCFNNIRPKYDPVGKIIQFPHFVYYCYYFYYNYYYYYYCYYYYFLHFADKVLLTTLNSNFIYFKSFKTLLIYRRSTLEVFSWRRVFCGSAMNFRGCICAWVRSSFCIFVLFWVCCMLPEHLSGRTLLADSFWAQIILHLVFNLLSVINYTFGKFH